MNIKIKTQPAYFNCISLLFFGLVFVACNPNKPEDKKKTYALNKEKESEVGAKYYFTITNNTETYAEVKSEKVSNTSFSTICFIWEDMYDSAGKQNVKITYDSIYSKMKNGNQEKEINSGNAAYSINPAEKMLGLLKGSSIVVSLNSNGEVVSVSGYQEITDKLLSEAQINDLSQRKQITEQFNNLLGENFVKSNIGLSQALLPDSTVHIGESWTKNENDNNELHIPITTTYTLTDVTNNVATIKSTAEIKNANGVNILGTGAQFTEIQGSIKSTFQKDLATGLLKGLTSQIKIKGDMQIMAMTVPAEIIVKREIQSRKIK